MSQRAAKDSRSPDVATMRVGSGSWFCGREIENIIEKRLTN
jgi:hypothetical protein